jgi:S1-C subfamily serine protease
MSRTRIRWVALFALLVGLAGGAWLAEDLSLWQPASAQNSETAATRPVNVTQAGGALPAPRQAAPMPTDLSPDEQRNIRVYDTANRSVVNIDTKLVEMDGMFGMPREAEGAGSGAVLDRQGHIITNYHVIDGAQQIEVTLASNSSFPAKLVGGDKEYDIAVLKIDAPQNELFPIAMGASDNLRVGQRVFAMGNPFGWEGTMTTGIISSLKRDLPSRVEGRTMKALIQTDAPMNPGNSGGPLLDSNGRMIGMCVAIATRTGSNTGIGFAIPIDRIRANLPELIQKGHIVRADIGIIDVVETDSGLVIRRLKPDGPAAKAGLKGFRVVQRRVGNAVYNAVDRSQADIILGMDGEEIHSGVQFQDKIWQHKPGDKVVLNIYRGGKQIDVPVTLGGD